MSQTITFERIAAEIPRLSETERETLEILLDEEFSRVLLERGAEIEMLRKDKKLLSLADLKKEINL